MENYDTETNFPLFLLFRLGENKFQFNAFAFDSPYTFAAKSTFQIKV